MHRAWGLAALGILAASCGSTSSETTLGDGGGDATSSSSGGRASSGSSGGSDAGGSGSSDAAPVFGVPVDEALDGEVPVTHQASGASCPSQRGTFDAGRVYPTGNTQNFHMDGGSCASDSDCEEDGDSEDGDSEDGCYCDIDKLLVSGTLVNA